MGEYNEVAFRVRAMYEGNGVLKVFVGFDYDAPYFRWKNSAKKEYEIKFKTLKDLEKKLNKLLKQIEGDL